MVTKTKSRRRSLRYSPSSGNSFTTIDILRSSSSGDSISRSSSFQDDKKKKNGNEFDAKAYLDQRVMTPMQEACNALTMIPGMIFSVWFVLSGSWIMQQDGAEIEQQIMTTQMIDNNPTSGGWLTNVARQLFGGFDFDYTLTAGYSNFGCIKSTMFPNLTALPPPAVLIVAFTGFVHPIFSILFHINCMFLEPSKRIPHWSRRLDHSFIHFASACASYGTSGSVVYFLLNVFFNLDCAIKQFETKICPKRNVRNVGLSIAWYILPVLLHGHYILFGQFCLMFILAGWSFSKYPIGGWSHSLFHVFLAFLPYLMFMEAVQLDSSRDQIIFAAQCASGAA